MLKHHISLSFRHLKKSKLSLFVNITGLTLGIISCMLIYLFVSSHLGYDSFHKNANSLYRVVRDDKNSTSLIHEAGSPLPLCRTIREEIPEIKTTTVVCYINQVLLSVGDKKLNSENIMFVEPEYFRMFDVKWITGNEGQFHTKNKIAITPLIAQQYFGTEDVVGKIIKYDNRIDLEVVGLIEPCNPKTHFRYNTLVSSETLDDQVFGFHADAWTVTLSQIETYVKVDSQSEIASINRKLNELNQRHVPKKESETQTYYLQPMSEVHFATEYGSFGSDNTISKKYLWIFSAVGAIILLLACVNFINLSLAGLLDKKKEIAILKSLSASRNQVVRQVLTETSIVVIVCLIISTILLELITNLIFSAIGMNLTYSIFSNPDNLVILLLTGFIVVIVSGIYPALMVSKQNPIEAFNSVKSYQPGGVGFTRNALILFQFFISVVLIACTLTISKQLNYIKQTDLGFKKDGIISVYVPTSEEHTLNLLRQKMATIPGVNDYSLCMGAPLSSRNMQTSFNLLDTPVENDTYIIVRPVDEAYYKTFNLKLLAGSWISDKHTNQANKQFVFTRDAIRKLGITDPQKAIGQNARVSRYNGTIVGVVEDIHSEPLHEGIKPVAFYCIPTFLNSLEVNVGTTGIDKTIAKISKAYTEVFPNEIFDYTVLDESISANYQAEQRTMNLIKLFTFIAIAIACLGLLGLVSKTLVHRTKEIGIRRVNGAQEWQIIQTLNRDFTRWVLIAFVIGTPVAWYAMNNWLSNFAYHTNLSWWIFALSGIAVLIIALLTISIQSYKAATRNPVEALRYE